MIELATPQLIRGFTGVILACGEASDRKWNQYFQDRMAGTPVEFFVEPAFNYVSEQERPADQISRRIRNALRSILSGNSSDCLVWAHNLGVGRNLLLARELGRACLEHDIPLIAHHHDWWFDNRWFRWSEARRCGFRELRAVAETVFPPIPNSRHVAINQADVRVLRRHLRKGSACWLPNLADPAPRPSEARAGMARDWLHRRFGDDAPVWLVPCRLLRRKNIAEALLLTRWLRPEAWLATTAGVSSNDEQAYARTLDAAAHRHGWRLRLGILSGGETGNPGVNELLAASEAVLLTSIQEGFGLPFLEATSGGRPLIARAIPNVAPDLARFGFHFPQCYKDLLIDPGLFDWHAERQRQRILFSAWKKHLPVHCRQWTGVPVLLAPGGNLRAVAFSRLTLTAQLEVLAQPPAHSWDLCAPLNPFLSIWRRRAAAGRLQLTSWPRTASRWLSGPSYARRFERIALRMPRVPTPAKSAVAAQEEFIRERLGSEYLFPLLWPWDTSPAEGSPVRHA